MKTNHLLTTSIVLAMLVSHPARAAVTEGWVHRYSNVVSNYVESNVRDQAFKVVRDAAGDIIVTGTTDDSTSGSDVLTIKYSGADGSVLWQTRYGGPTNSYDGSQALAVDGSGNVVVTASSFMNPSGSVFYTAKYAAADGALLWEKQYNGPADSYDGDQVLAVDGNGNVVVTGYSGGSGGVSDYYTAKYAADGALLWERRSTNGRPSAVALDSNGNVVVTGSYSENQVTADYYTAKYAAADGALLWEQRYNGPANRGDGATAVAVDGSGNVAVTGHSSGIFNTEYYTAKYAAADGALLWERRYDAGSGEGMMVAVDGSGNVVVTGPSAILGNIFNQPDYYTAKYAAADGALLWEQRYDGPANSYDVPQAVAVDAGGNVLVTGSSYNTNFSGDRASDYYTAKYAAADGALLWEQRYNGPANSADFANAMVVDGSGNVVVTGSSSGDYYTAKYAAADGALLWEQRYDAPGTAFFSANDQANAVAVDGGGNVAVTGSSWNSSGNSYDFYTAKYSAGTGALLWEQRYNGPLNDYDQAQAVAVDDGGNVVVTGYSYGTNFNADYYTAKYAAADGALLWEQRYDGPANSYDVPQAVAVDAGGNVVVTGSSGYHFGRPYNFDYYTAKYAAADGSLLWEQRYNGPANSYDSAQAVAVDSSGNVVVTGHSAGTNFSSDCYTAKYAAANGALLWEQRYNGPANSYDSAQAVAVDGNGNVVVTGSSNNGTNSDFYTAKYASADGALLWEQRYNGPANYDEQAQAVAVDGSGNVVVTGVSYNGSNDNYYTAKYASADGSLLWEKRSTNSVSAVALDGRGNAVVTGSSNNGINQDYYTAKYAAADGALLWEQRYNGPVNGNDFVGGANSLAIGPGGTVAITGSSDGIFGSEYATVVYREIVRGGVESLLADLIALRATVTDLNDGRKLDEAIRHLTKSLAAKLWSNETHLGREHGGRVFHEEKLTATILCNLIKSRTSHTPDAVLQGLIDRIFEADRLLAAVAIEDAIMAGVSNKEIEQAQKFLARGDTAAADDKCHHGIEYYRRAWRRATR